MANITGTTFWSDYPGLLSQLTAFDRLELDRAVCAGRCGRYKECDNAFGDLNQALASTPAYVFNRADILYDASCELERYRLLHSPRTNSITNGQPQSVVMLLELMKAESEFYLHGAVQPLAVRLHLTRDYLKTKQFTELTDVEIRCIIAYYDASKTLSRNSSDTTEWQDITYSEKCNGNRYGEIRRLREMLHQEQRHCFTPTIMQLEIEEGSSHTHEQLTESICAARWMAELLGQSTQAALQYRGAVLADFLATYLSVTEKKSLSTYLREFRTRTLHNIIISTTSYSDWTEYVPKLAAKMEQERIINSSESTKSKYAELDLLAQNCIDQRNYTRANIIFLLRSKMLPRQKYPDSLQTVQMSNVRSMISDHLLKVVNFHRKTSRIAVFEGRSLCDYAAFAVDHPGLCFDLISRIKDFRSRHEYIVKNELTDYLQQSQLGIASLQAIDIEEHNSTGLHQAGLPNRKSATKPSEDNTGKLPDTLLSSSGLPTHEHSTSHDEFAGAEITQNEAVILLQNQPENDFNELTEDMCRSESDETDSGSSASSVLPDVVDDEVTTRGMTLNNTGSRDIERFKLEQLQDWIHQRFVRENVFNMSYAVLFAGDYQMYEDLYEDDAKMTEVLMTTLDRLARVFGYIRDSLSLIKAQSDTDPTFNLITESSRPVLNIVSVSGETIEAFQDILSHIIDRQIIDNSSQSGPTSKVYHHLMILGKMSVNLLLHLELELPRNLSFQNDVLSAIANANIASQVLAIGITSYVNSHIVDAASQTIFQVMMSTRFRMQVDDTCYITCTPRRLACLDPFVKSPVLTFAYGPDIQQNTTPYPVSTLLADFNDLWGPVEIFYASENDNLASEVLTFGGKLQAITSSNADLSSIAKDDETICHWSPWSAPEPDHQDFDPTSLLLIGVNLPLFRVNDDCVSPERQPFYQLWKRSQLHTRPQKIEKSGVSYSGSINIPFVGQLSRNQNYRLSPGESSKNILIQWFYNVDRGKAVSSNIPACIDEIVGLEISRCNGNALRVSLWDIVRNPDVSQFVQDTMNFTCAELPDNWESYGSWRSLRAAGHMTRLQHNNLLSAISKVVEQIRGTGVLEPGQITAWNVPTTEAYTFKSSWTGMLTDNDHTATFAILSSRCFVYDYGRQCSQSSRLNEPLPSAMLTRIEVTAKLYFNLQQCDPNKFLPSQDTLRRAPEDDHNGHLGVFITRKKKASACSSEEISSNFPSSTKLDEVSPGAMQENNKTAQSDVGKAAFDEAYFSDDRSIRPDLTSKMAHSTGSRDRDGASDQCEDDANFQDSRCTASAPSKARSRSSSRKASTRSGEARKTTHRAARANVTRAASLNAILRQHLATAGVPLRRSTQPSTRSSSSKLKSPSFNPANSTAKLTRQFSDDKAEITPRPAPGALYDALQRQKIRLPTWQLDSGHGRLEFSRNESRHRVRFDYNSTLSARPLRMIWKPKAHKLDPSQALAAADGIYEKGDLFLRKMMNEVRGSVVPGGACDVNIEYEFREAKRVLDIGFHQSMKWICVLEKEV